MLLVCQKLLKECKQDILQETQEWTKELLPTDTPHKKCLGMDTEMSITIFKIMPEVGLEE